MPVIIRTKDNNALKLSEYRKNPCDNYWKYYIRKGKTHNGVTGVNGCIAGLWSNGTSWSEFALPNCVGYAHGRALEIWESAGASSSDINKLKQLTTNAENFIYLAYTLGLNVKTPYKMRRYTSDMNDYEATNYGDLIRDYECVPKVGSICVFGKGSLSSSPAGHVTVCESVNGTIGVFSESGYKYDWSNIFTSKEYDPLCYANGSGGYTNKQYKNDLRYRLNPGLGGYYFLGYVYPPKNIEMQLQSGTVEVMGDESQVYNIQNKLWVP